MKSSSYLIFILAFLMLATTGIWMFQTEPQPSSFQEVIHVIIIVVIVAFAMVLAFRRSRAMKRGQPGEDEFSNKIMLKASSWSYFASLYLWIIVLYLNNKEVAETHILIAGGILGMAVLIVVFYLIFRLIGIRNV